MVRNSLVCKVKVYDIFDWSTEVGKVFDVEAIFHDSRLSAKESGKGHAVRVQSHTDFFDLLDKS